MEFRGGEDGVCVVLELYEDCAWEGGVSCAQSKQTRNFKKRGYNAVSIKRHKGVPAHAAAATAPPGPAAGDAPITAKHDNTGP